MFNLQHRFFAPPWRRTLTSVVVVGWALLELATGNPGWALIFGAAGAWCCYQFFVVWEDPPDDEED